MTTWQEMTPRKKDVLVAEKVMGDIRDSGGSWISHDGSKITCADNGPKYYTTDYAAARLVEDEIERRGLVEPYTQSLLQCVHPTMEEGTVGLYPFWRILRATPDQRCYTALKAIGVL